MAGKKGNPLARILRAFRPGPAQEDMPHAEKPVEIGGTGDMPDAQDAVFLRELAGSAYDDIPALRRALSDFLRGQGLPAAYDSRLMLTMTEVLTNLARHPEDKPRHVRISLRIGARDVALDIADDSTPFSDFEEKRKAALQPHHAGETMRESGYGLPCILKQHSGISYVPAEKSADGLNHFRVSDARGDIAAPAPPAPPREARRGRVFVVDDDPVTLAANRKILGESYDVTAFSAAIDAVKEFSRNRPDIVISDLHMPEMDGAALRRALSVLPGGDVTPFIFLSAQSEGAQSPYINALGVDDFLCKPVEPAQLKSVVERLIRRAQQVRQSLEGRFHEDLNRYLKPALPERYGGWRITTLNRMAEAGGGDFTLHRETPEQMTVFLADVMGHGAQAKFFAYAYAGYLRSLFRREAGAEDPAAFLASLSDAVEGDAFLESIIMTCQCFRLSDGGRVDIASAGHPCPGLVREDGGGEIIEVAGPLPGLVAAPRYALKSLTLKPGESLVFATDGFLQSFDDKATVEGLFQRLAEAEAGDMRKPPLPTLLWNEFLAAQALTDRAPDDATLIIAEYGGTS
ncbi:MAG: SpoIIE family protein phosphatase [Alphaproteobacteria bacterium]|nr:SpoIIE family protein phosphatase [Alphaproteobacteria bacterium]